MAQASGSFTLFLMGPSGTNNNVPLYMRGQTSGTQGLNLYLAGPGISQAALNLHLNPRGAPTSGNLPLVMTGASSGTIYDFDAIPLYITGEPITTNMNLFMLGSLGDPTTYEDFGLNLYIHGSGHRANNACPLVVWGSNGLDDSLNDLELNELDEMDMDELNDLLLEGAFNGWYCSNDLSLYIMGDGIASGYVPSGTFMNLYLQGGTGSESGINIFMQGYEPPEQNLNLYTFGVLGSPTSGVSLYTFGTDPQSSPLPLFIRGFTMSLP
jgi:hypothetical protein